MKSIFSAVVVDEAGMKAVEAAQKARIESLTQHHETGVPSAPNGNTLSNYVCQYFTKITPNAENLDCFMCRHCGFVTKNHIWHQHEEPNGHKKHHFRCVICWAMYSPWKEGTETRPLAKFNKVLVVTDINNLEDDQQHIVLPTYWAENHEERFINVMKEYANGVGAEMPNGAKSEDYNVAVTAIGDFLKRKDTTGGRKPNERWPGFSMHTAPRADKECSGVWDINGCTGFGHVNTELQRCPGFFFPNFLEVQDSDIFKDWDLLIDELTSMIRKAKTV